jgi:hypothetical protein
MKETHTAEVTAGLIGQIAHSLGYPVIVIESLFFGFLIVLLLAVVFAVMAIFRIRKEMISLNFKIAYIGRLIEQAVKGPRLSKAAEEVPKDRPRKPAPAEPIEANEKFKL